MTMAMAIAAAHAAFQGCRSVGFYKFGLPTQMTPGPESAAPDSCVSVDGEVAVIPQSRVTHAMEDIPV